MRGSLLAACHSSLSLPSLAQPSGSQPWMQTRITWVLGRWGWVGGSGGVKFLMPRLLRVDCEREKQYIVYTWRNQEPETQWFYKGSRNCDKSNFPNSHAPPPIPLTRQILHLLPVHLELFSLFYYKITPPAQKQSLLLIHTFPQSLVKGQVHNGYLIKMTVSLE